MRSWHLSQWVLIPLSSLLPPFSAQCLHPPYSFADEKPRLSPEDLGWELIRKNGESYVELWQRGETKRSRERIDFFCITSECVHPCWLPII